MLLSQQKKQNKFSRDFRGLGIALDNKRGEISGTQAQEQQQTGREAEEVSVFTGETIAHRPRYHNLKKIGHNQSYTMSY